MRQTIFRFRRPMLVIGVIATIGTLILVISRASSSYISLETEDGSTVGANISLDSTASGGKYVLFGDSATSENCSKGGKYLWDNLEKCGWPGPNNTGVNMSECPNGLTPLGSSITSITTIKTENTTIECKEVKGSLNITAQNVTIKNSKVSYDAGGPTKGGSGVIKILDDASATIEQVELDGMNKTHACIFNLGVKGKTLKYSMIVKKVNCHNASDGIFSWYSAPGSDYPSKYPNTASDSIIEDSYLHDFTEGAANGHIDGYQTQGTSNGIIRRNTFNVFIRPGDTHVEGGGLNSVMAIWNVSNNVNNYEISNNLISGGGFTIYAYDRHPEVKPPEKGGNGVGGYYVKGVKVLNNSFSNYFNKCVGKYGVWFERSQWPPLFGGPTGGWSSSNTTDSNYRSGNKVLETGLNLDTGNPAGCK